MLEYFKNKTTSSKQDQDILYEYVLDEMQFGKPRKGLLTKAVLESEGDDDKAKSLYLQYRVEGIQKEVDALEIDINKIDKEELFTLIENDFKGYKKSFKILKKLFYFSIFLLVVAVLVVLYLFLPQPLIKITNTNTPQENHTQNTQVEEKSILVKKDLKGIIDKYGNLYKEVKSPFTGRVWLDRNLGAKELCGSYDDEKCFGDYFQWGRGADGHEKEDATVTEKLSIGDVPEHKSFILGSRDNRYDWLKVQNNTLWQGLYGENNPCPQGFRVPTAGEFKAELIDNGGNNKHKIYKSFLKLPMAGFRSFDGVVTNQGFEGRYWTSSRKSQFSLAFSSSNSGEKPYIFFFERSNGYSLRCIKESK